VISAIARVEVDDIDTALPLYQKLSGGAEIVRFSFASIDLAWVGSFLLLSGPPDDLAAARRTATLLVDEIETLATTIRTSGGEVLEGPGPGPNGPRMIARHPDGSVFEYIQAATMSD
jgi:hypothetical protein